MSWIDEQWQSDITEALVWLKEHPHRDVIDAAFSVVANPYSRPRSSDIGGRRWPEFLAAIRQQIAGLPPPPSA